MSCQLNECPKLLTVCSYPKVGIKKYLSSNLVQKLIESTNAQFSTKATAFANPMLWAVIFQNVVLIIN